jgi:hypothetical protein
MILVVFILRAVRKTVAGRGVDTILIGLPAHIIPVGGSSTVHRHPLTVPVFFRERYIYIRSSFSGDGVPRRHPHLDAPHPKGAEREPGIPTLCVGMRILASPVP